MKVKFYDSGSEQSIIISADDVPIMIILDEADKENIAEMEPEATKYCQYPKEFHDTINEFMKTEDIENTEYKVK